MLEPEDLLLILRRRRISYRLYHHPPIGCGDCAHLFPQVEGVILKNLVLSTKKGQLVLFTLPLAAQANLKAVAAALGLTRFSFARAGELGFLGVPPGMVSPLALLNDRGGEITYAVPQELTALPLVNCHPLDNSMSIDIKLSDLHSLVAESGHQIQVLQGCLQPEPPEAERP